MKSHYILNVVFLRISFLVSNTGNGRKRRGTKEPLDEGERGE